MSKYDVLVILSILIVLAGGIFFSKWFFEVVIESDMPDWVKYMLLK